jgi:hypothetical protein
MEIDDGFANGHRWRMVVPTGVDGAATAGGGGWRKEEWKKAMWWNWSGGLPKDKNGSNWTAAGGGWRPPSCPGLAWQGQGTGAMWGPRASEGIQALPLWFRQLPRDSGLDRHLRLKLPQHRGLDLFLFDNKSPNWI